MSRSKSLCGQYLTILLCLIGLAACTATAPRPAPSRALLQNSLDAIRSTYRLPGATAAIVFRDGSMVSVASGFADAEAGTPMTPETRMLAGSIGKTFVAATILSLAEEGRLDLDEAISHWLGHRDWFARLPNADDITVRQLLSHRSGLPDHVHSARFMEAW
ncbi:MAG: beta-lactamase family protein, partial [Halioglobus sp.]|nr:beta-lactamase family protein [Halioglobus sp.]